MSIMRIGNIGNARARNLGVAPEIKTSVIRIDPVKDWPPSRQLALMLVRRTEFVKPVAQRLSRGTVMAQRHDWRWLKGNGYIERHEKTGYLVPTPIGGSVADQLAFHHAGELRMHIFKPSGGQWHEAGILCSCGWSCCVRTGEHTQARIYAAQSSHLAAVENGTYKPARPVGEILDELFNKGTG